MGKPALTCKDPGLFFHDCEDCQYRETCDFQFKKEVKILEEKKKRPTTRKRIDRQRLTEIKRQLNSKKLKSENQELLLKFDKAYKDMTYDDAGAVLAFVYWLENSGHQIVHGKTVFCFPFGRMVRVKDLK